MDSKIVMEGHLWKKGHIRRNWTQRYFKLDANELAYFKDTTKKGQIRFGGKKQSKIVIRSSQDGAIHAKKGSSGSTEWRFEIQLWESTQINHIMLSAATKEDMNKWVVAIYDIANRHVRVALEPVVPNMNLYRKESDRKLDVPDDANSSFSGSPIKKKRPDGPGPKLPSPPPQPKKEEKPLRVRQHSLNSNIAISALMDYGDIMDELQKDLEEIQKNIESSTPTMEMVGGYRSRVAQLNGSLAKLQATKIDAVLTGHLISAKDDARAMRKVLNQRAEKMGDETLTLGSRLTQLKCALMEGKDPNELTRVESSACMGEGDDDDDDDDDDDGHFTVQHTPTTSVDVSEVTELVSGLDVAPAVAACEWAEAKDEYDRTYYYNTRTNVTQWEVPAELQQTPTPPEPPPAVVPESEPSAVVPPPFAVSHTNGEDDDDDAVVASITATYDPSSSAGATDDF
jgi:hypothetical protein